MLGILGKKIGMTQIFEDGKFVPVTVVEAGPNFVLQKKTFLKQGYRTTRSSCQPIYYLMEVMNKC